MPEMPEHECFCMGVNPTAEKVTDETDKSALRFGVQHDKFRDELNGLLLDAALFRAAWAKEIACFRSRRVWETKHVNEARAKSGWHPIAERWVETNKDEVATHHTVTSPLIY